MAPSTDVPHALHDLDTHVQVIEAQLHDLDVALREGNTGGLAASSAALHAALARALEASRGVQQQGKSGQAGQGTMSQDLRRRLMLAQGRVAGLQQVLHFASGSIERTLAVILPRDDAAAPLTSSSAGPRTPVAAALSAYRG